GQGRGGTRPPVDEAEGIRLARAGPARPVVVQELGLVGRHVDVDRAVRLASLARQAEVERLLDARVAPTAAADRVALEHLEQQAGPGAGRGLRPQPRPGAPAPDA